MIIHLGLAIATFGLTNIDDLLILSVYFASDRHKIRSVVAGQYLGIAALILISLSGTAAGHFFEIHWVSLLGLLPVLLGIRGLIKRNEAEEELPLHKTKVQFLSVALVTIANGGDNIGVYAPLFATMKTSYVGFYIAIFLLLTGVWCFLGYWLVRHPLVSNIFSKHGKLILPFFLIALGLFILKDFIVWVLRSN
jgi:cadmium resistance protein CadD (predicted permease)